jgi:hypothetical protein
VSALTGLLLLLGVCFLVLNLRLGVDFFRYLRLRSSALLTWPGPRPRYYGILLATGVVLGVLIVYKLVFLGWPVTQVFGESMMFVYYAYALPLSLRIKRGFYATGIWSESRFIPYGQVGSVRWREGPELTLLVVLRSQAVARRLTVPGPLYAAARRLLRDKVASHDLHLGGTGLDLGTRDEREDL